MIKVEWQNPKKTPEVEVGTETEFWLAVAIKRNNETTVVTFLGQYQNRPYSEGDEDYGDEALVECIGEYVNSVGWVTCQPHVEFDNYYEPFTFNEDYDLLGWANYSPPKYN